MDPAPLRARVRSAASAARRSCAHSTQRSTTWLPTRPTSSSTSTPTSPSSPTTSRGCSTASTRDPALGIASGSAFELQDGSVAPAARDRLDGLGRVAGLPLGVPAGDPALRGAGGLGRHRRVQGERPAAGRRRRSRTSLSDTTAARASATAPGGRGGTRATRRTTSAIARGTSSCARSSTPAVSRPSLGMIAGYAAAFVRREPRSDDLAARAYLRRQQSVRHLRLRSLEATGHRDRAA